VSGRQDEGTETRSFLSSLCSYSPSKLVRSTLKGVKILKLVLYDTL